MTNTDIKNYVTFRSELENLINHYIGELDLPATFLRPIVADALISIDKVSADEIKCAFEQDETVAAPVQEEFGFDNVKVGLSE